MVNVHTIENVKSERSRWSKSSQNVVKVVYEQTLTSNLLHLHLLDVDYEQQNWFGVMPIGPRVHHGDHDGRDGHDGLHDGQLGGRHPGGRC